MKFLHSNDARSFLKNIRKLHKNFPNIYVIILKQKNLENIYANMWQYFTLILFPSLNILCHIFLWNFSWYLSQAQHPLYLLQCTGNVFNFFKAWRKQQHTLKPQKVGRLFFFSSFFFIQFSLSRFNWASLYLCLRLHIYKKFYPCIIWYALGALRKKCVILIQ